MFEFLKKLDIFESTGLFHIILNHEYELGKKNIIFFKKLIINIKYQKFNNNNYINFIIF